MESVIAQFLHFYNGRLNIVCHYTISFWQFNNLASSRLGQSQDCVMRKTGAHLIPIFRPFTSTAKVFFSFIISNYYPIFIIILLYTSPYSWCFHINRQNREAEPLEEKPLAYDTFTTYYCFNKGLSWALVVGQLDGSLTLWHTQLLCCGYWDVIGY